MIVGAASGPVCTLRSAGGRNLRMVLTGSLPALLSRPPRGPPMQITSSLVLRTSTMVLRYQTSQRRRRGRRVLGQASRLRGALRHPVHMLALPRRVHAIPPRCLWPLATRLSPQLPAGSPLGKRDGIARVATSRLAMVETPRLPATALLPSLPLVTLPTRATCPLCRRCPRSCRRTSRLSRLLASLHRPPSSTTNPQTGAGERHSTT